MSKTFSHWANLHVTEKNILITAVSREGHQDFQKRQAFTKVTGQELNVLHVYYTLL